MRRTKSIQHLLLFFFFLLIIEFYLTGVMFQCFKQPVDSLVIREIITIMATNLVSGIQHQQQQ